ncbi:GTPase Era [Sporomusa termitida]|uniref:GTPase Era n=1 Tax=Sporomusa termitida TaxID=2377 RepID=A0A517DUB2_9FIRM|nr:GTPase Era [Sporomusa termitida]QDR80931.1 GTPase Era [Sporomusa termitida]
MDKENYKSGFVAVIGRPNVGKSTLMNNLIGQKIAIMSDKPQTTRNKIMGVLTQADAQILFIDTPGIHKPKHKLGEYMLKEAEGSLRDVDVILFVVDVTAAIGPGERYILEQLANVRTPVILAVNKIDRIDKPKLFAIIEKYTSQFQFAAVVPISALDHTNFAGLIGEIKTFLEPGPQYYPEDMITDQPERLVIAELIREKVLHLTKEEIPHAILVDIEEIATRANDDLYVRAVIYVERDSQKGIVIGAGGHLLKDIGRFARADIENLLGSKVYLDLWVKVKKDWRNRANVLKSYGFD